MPDDSEIDRIGHTNRGPDIVASGCLWIVAILLAFVVIFGGFGFYMDDNRMDNVGADHPHQWFAWKPVRLQGGQPIPSVKEGGRVVWLKTIERFRFFDRWVYREIGDKREMTR